MKTLSILFCCISLSMSSALVAVPPGCKCPNCKCTIESHCGCYSKGGCKCGANGSCSCPCGEDCDCGLDCECDCGESYTPRLFRSN